ncbi:MAG: extracellular solute-binding protein [Chloroflexi bacterium]|nr:extracellular solute-binding protein [Chloroflexota bacterium]
MVSDRNVKLLLDDERKRPMVNTGKLMAALIALVSLIYALGACARGSVPSPGPPSVSTSQPGTDSGWNTIWDTTLQQAKKEGVVTVYNIWRPETRVTLTQAFKDKYDITVEFSPFARGSDMLAKLQAESRAGLNTADILGAGTTSLSLMKPDGLLAPIEPVLILPEVVNPKAWRGERLPFVDKETMAIMLIGAMIRNTVINTSLTSKEEITSYRDLLKPQYKGKIVMNDPTVSGGGNFLLAHLAFSLWGEEETKTFLRQLIKDQKAVVQRDTHLQVEEVARGKYGIGLGPRTEEVTNFLNLGAPLKLALIKEENRISAAAGAMGMSARPAHPNAAKIFVNWVLTKEGQTVFSRSFGNPSTRVDVPAEGIDPLWIPVAGEKYFQDSEQFLPVLSKWLEISKKVISEASN